MKYLLISLVIMLLAPLADAQDSLPKRKLTYKISIAGSGLNVQKGYLLQLTDTTVQISDSRVRFANKPFLKEDHKEIAYPQIASMTLKRTNGAGRGAWKGALAGAFLGIIAGYIDGDDPTENWFRYTAGDKALMYAVVGAPAGAIIGTLTGALVKKKFIIGGKKEKFDKMKINILNKVYGPNIVPRVSK